MNTQNIKQIKTTNVEIARAMHKGGVIWSKTFWWEEYTVGELTTIGYFSTSLTKEEIMSKYPNYIDFEFINTGYGTYKVSAAPLKHIGGVSSKNKNDYPDKGIKNGYYYELIN